MTPLLPTETSASLIGNVHLADCLELCERVYRAGVRVDMILADLPYQVHEAAWDQIIPIEPMWAAFKRIIKPRGAIVLTCTMRFAVALISSNPTWFKYDWVIEKNIATDMMNAKNKPLRGHEHILIFSDGTTANRSPRKMRYYPQMQPGEFWKKFSYAETSNKSNYGMRGRKAFQTDHWNEGGLMRYPQTILKWHYDNNTNLHPNMKPVEGFRYLIRTYTLPNELVFDPVVGSGTTAVAAREEGRRYIVGDSSPEYVAVTNRRIDAPYTPSFMPALEAITA